MKTLFAVGKVQVNKKRPAVGGRDLAIRRGLEPLTSSVTGWHSNQLNYRTMWWAFRDLNPGPIGYEPTALTN